MSRSSITCALLASLLVALPGSRAESARQISARLIGPYHWVKVDADSNGEAEELRLEGRVRVKAPPGEFVPLSVLTGLYKDSQFITYQPGDSYQANYYVRSIGSFARGVHPFSLAFGGEAIRRSKLDGPYRAVLDLAEFPPRTASFDSLNVESPPLRSAEFGELPYRMIGATERGVDDNGDGLFDALVIDTRVLSPNVSWAAPEVWLAIPGSKETLYAMSAKTLIGRGVTTIPVRIEGSEIQRRHLDGPYRVTVHVLSMGSDATGRELKTRPYHWRDFAPPAGEPRLE